MLTNRRRHRYPAAKAVPRLRDQRVERVEPPSHRYGVPVDNTFHLRPRRAYGRGAGVGRGRGGGLGLGDGVGRGVEVGVAVAVGVGVGVGVAPPTGAWIATVVGEPVLK